MIRLAAGLALACMLSVAAPAIAQEVVAPVPETVIVIPYSDWLNEALVIVRNVALAAVPIILGWAGRELPWWASQWLKTKAAEQLLARAIDAGINKVRGAAPNTPLSLDVGNAVLKQAADYALGHGSKALIDWLGGRKGIEDRILARLNLDARSAL